MNERIKELVRQAGGISHDDDNNELAPVLAGSSLEKFSELLVKECARVAFNSDLTMAIGQWAAHSAILKHVGVE